VVAAVASCHTGPVPVAFLIVSLWGALFTLNAYRPARDNQLLVGPSFFASWLTGELPLHHLAWQLVGTAYFVANGALDAAAGIVGSAVTLASWAGLVGLAIRGVHADRIVQDVVDRGLGPETPAVARFRRRHLVVPFSRMREPGVRVQKNIVYARAAGRELHLDVFAPREPGANRPALVYVHGGAWVLGFRDRQGIPLLVQMAAAGWVCVRPEYRLSPAATFPDHLVDVKRAIAWTREHAAELGIDPAFVAGVGGSAGGHLVTLAALTFDVPEYQPGFEASDTSLQAVVPMYGVFDLTNRTGARSGSEFTEFLEKYVMKSFAAEDANGWSKASPIDQVRADAPPCFVLHGQLDNLAPVEDSRLFVDTLRAVSSAPVLYAEFPGAGHVFDLFPSFRSARAVAAIHRFLDWARSATKSPDTTPEARDAGRVPA